MRVLLTNDDGINSPGLRALAETFAAHHETAVVAPEHERSATGHAITLHKPLRAIRYPAYPPGIVAWSTNGTPADCVVLGVGELLGYRPDVIVSGVNVGPNLGLDLTYSGTVSGAMEGAILGIPSLAVSVTSFVDVRFDVAARFAESLARLMVAHRLPDDVLINVNVPNLPAERLKGIAFTRQSNRRYLSRLEKRTDPRGRSYYWLTGEREPTNDQEGTDGWAVANGYISVTPIHLNMTDDRLLEVLRTWGLTVP
ncbi:MAG: 5'/3'-nucleotidase SurE [Armatimonadetes bacterium]|nr:5'/3'-nucleotidase SurE [Armatimonadota bacterium]